MKKRELTEAQQLKGERLCVNFEAMRESVSKANLDIFYEDAPNFGLNMAGVCEPIIMIVGGQVSQPDNGFTVSERHLKLLTGLLHGASLTQDDISFIYAIPYRLKIPGQEIQMAGRKPTEEELKFFRPFALKYIEIMNPRAIVTLGVDAIDCLVGYEDKRLISQCIDKTFNYKDWPIFPAYSLEYLIRDPNIEWRNKFIDSLNRAKNFVKDIQTQ